jgi:uncharacterized membrane protein YsdA (DUF1294 family)
MTGQIIGALAVVNLITFLSWYDDKRRATRGLWRVPESRLLGLALLGGTPAAFAARSLLRHKTRKEPFLTQLQLIAAVQLGAGAVLLW